MNAEQIKHYEAKLAYEMDPVDLHAAREAGQNVIVVDARKPETYAAGHIAGAINIPHRTISAETTAQLDKKALIVAYCDGIGCNASTHGALKLAKLGFNVRELVGGFEWWTRDGLPVEK